MGMMRFLAFLLLAAAWAVTPAQAREEILSYETLVDVEIDGDFIVTERITVRAEGFEIRRGIFRDFPTVRRLPSGLVDRTTFEVMSVTRDGAAEPHHEEPIEGGTRLYIGSADVWIPPASTPTRSPIARATKWASLRISTRSTGTPPAISGPSPSSGRSPRSNCRRRADHQHGLVHRAFWVHQEHGSRQHCWPNTVRFETTSTLAAREGLTVAVSFQKG
jgi:hypothetical protein